MNIQQNPLSRVAREMTAFNTCLINKAAGLAVRYYGNTGRFILRDGNGRKVIASRDFDDIENAAEKITANQSYRIAA
jgi:hypothetical protein